MSAPAITVFALTGMGEVQPGDDLVALILDTGVELAHGDILVVTSKIVSKAEGRYVQAADREEAITAETHDEARRLLYGEVGLC